MSLRIHNLNVEIDEQGLLQDIDLVIEPGEMVAILGANGAGKSTLLKSIAGLQNYKGKIYWDTQLVSSLDVTERAKTISYLPQERPTNWPIRVCDVVALGRYAYGVSPAKLSEADKTIVDQAIADCDLTHLVSRSVDTLSGGEQARVHCARTFASGASLLLADEPTTSLDPRHQLEILSLLQGYVNDERSALVVLHEPALAARFADRLVWMKNGKIVALGTSEETLTKENLANVYDVEASVHEGQVEIHRPL